MSREGGAGVLNLTSARRRWAGHLDRGGALAGVRAGGIALIVPLAVRAQDGPGSVTAPGVVPLGGDHIERAAVEESVRGAEARRGCGEAGVRVFAGENEQAGGTVLGQRPGSAARCSWGAGDAAEGNGGLSRRATGDVSS